jgi:hypothetical protein
VIGVQQAVARQQQVLQQRFNPAQIQFGIPRGNKGDNRCLRRRLDLLRVQCFEQNSPPFALALQNAGFAKTVENLAQCGPGGTQNNRQLPLRR